MTHLDFLNELMAARTIEDLEFVRKKACKRLTPNSLDKFKLTYGIRKQMLGEIK